MVGVLTRGTGLSGLARLRDRPLEATEGTFGRTRFTAGVAIPNYAQRVAKHYGTAPEQTGIPFDFRHFGVVVDFEDPLELPVFDAERRLDDDLREVIAAFGPIMIRNAHLPDRERGQGQRNIFPSLRFHIDRGSTQADHYSLFWRDPFDLAHRMPRTSSTLIIANAVAYLQAAREGDRTPHFKSLYQLFEDEDVSTLVGDIMIEQAWSAPEGVGEITILDNRSVLHASYYARPEDRGYPIGVRYLY